MFVTDAFGGFGGISKFNRDLIAAIDASAATERVWVLPRVIPEPIKGPLPEFVVYDRAAARGLLSFVKRTLVDFARFRPDLVICGHLHLLPFAWLVARRVGAPLAMVIHGIEAWQPSPHSIANRLARSVDHLLAVSRYSADRFATWSRFPSDRAFLLPNSVALDRFVPGPPDPTLVRRYGLQGKRVLMTVGRLASEERYKGFDEVIEVMPELLRRYTDLVYLIVGEGADRARLERKVDAAKLASNVIFAGRIPEDEKVQHYNLSDCYVMPSSGEGFGIVLIEAAGCGVPIIGSAVDGSREALLNGQLGRLVVPSSREELLSAVCETLDSPNARVRNPALETFSEERFRERVDGWLVQRAEQSAAAGTRSG
jgi:glycosyltransferase involved in cell wall biosynthesis